MLNEPLTIGIGIVGCGVIGRRRGLIANSHPGTKVKAVFDVNGTKAGKVAAELGCQVEGSVASLVARDDVDAVVVSTPTIFLSEVSMQALSAGKHVLCEKPMGKSSAEVKKMTDAAKKNNRVLKAGFNHRFYPAISDAHRLVKSGELGPILFIRCRYGITGRPGYEKDWRMDPSLTGGGELIDQGIHAIDLFGWFLGEFKEVASFTSTLYWDAKVEDNAFALLKTESGQIASLHTSWTEWKNIFSFEIFCKEGYLKVDGLGGTYGKQTLTRGWKAPPTEWPPREEQTVYEKPEVCWTLEWDDFVNSVKSGTKANGSGDEGYQAMRLVDAIYESARMHSFKMLK